MAKKLKVGVIGAGMIARWAHFKGYAALPDDVEVVAICDLKPEAREAAKQAARRAGGNDARGRPKTLPHQRGESYLAGLNSTEGEGGGCRKSRCRRCGARIILTPDIIADMHPLQGFCDKIAIAKQKPASRLMMGDSV